MNREFSYIDAIEMSTYFENYSDGNDDFHLKGRVKEKLKKAFPKIAAVGAAVGLGIAFGPQLLAVIGPMLPAIKGYLIKQGVNVEGMGPGEKIKAFYQKVFKSEPDLKDKDGPKKTIEKILTFFKTLKEKKASGQLTGLEKMLVDKTEKTLSDIENDKVDAADLVNDELPGASLGKAKTDGIEVTTKIDTKIILFGILAVAVLYYMGTKK